MMKLTLHFTLIYQLTQLSQGFIILDGIQNLILSPPGCLACFQDEASNYFSSLNRLSPFCADQDIDSFRKIPKMFFFAHICIYQTGTGFQSKYNELQFQGNMVLKKFQKCLKKNSLEPVHRKLLKTATIQFEKGRKRCQNGSFLEGGLKGIRKFCLSPTLLPLQVHENYKKPKIRTKDQASTLVNYFTEVTEKQKTPITKSLPLLNTLTPENSTTDKKSARINDNNVPSDINYSKEFFDSEYNSVDRAQDEGITSDNVFTPVADSKMPEDQFIPMIIDVSGNEVQNNDIDFSKSQSQLFVNDAAKEYPTAESDPIINNTVEENITTNPELSLKDGIEENPIMDTKLLAMNVIEEDTTSDVKPSVNNIVQEYPVTKAKSLVNEAKGNNANIEPLSNDVIENITADAEPSVNSADAEVLVNSNKIDENIILKPDQLIKDAIQENFIAEVQNDEKNREGSIDSTEPLKSDTAKEKVIVEEVQNNETERENTLDCFENRSESLNEFNPSITGTSAKLQKVLITPDHQSQLLPTNSYMSEAKDDEMDSDFPENLSEPLVNKAVANNLPKLQDDATVLQDNPMLSSNNTPTDLHEDHTTSFTTHSQPFAEANNVQIIPQTGDTLSENDEGLILNNNLSPETPEATPKNQVKVINPKSISELTPNNDASLKESATVMFENQSTSIGKMLTETSRMPLVHNNSLTTVSEPISGDRSTPFVNHSSEEFPTPKINLKTKNDYSIPSQIDTFSDNLDLNETKKVDPITENNSAIPKLEVESEVDQRRETPFFQKKNFKESGSQVEPIPNERIGFQTADSNIDNSNGSQKEDPIREDNSTHLLPGIQLEGKKTFTTNDSSSTSLQTQSNMELVPSTTDSIVQNSNVMQKDVPNIENMSSSYSPAIKLEDRVASQNTNNSLSNSEGVKSEEEITFQPEIKLEDNSGPQTINNYFINNDAEEVKFDEEIVPHITDTEMEDLNQTRNNFQNNYDNSVPSSMENKSDQPVSRKSNKPLSEKVDEKLILQTTNSLPKDLKRIQKVAPITEDNSTKSLPNSKIKFEDELAFQTAENSILDNYSGEVKPIEEITSQIASFPIEDLNQIPEDTSNNEDTSIQSSLQIKLEDDPTIQTADDTSSEKSEDNIIPQRNDSSVENHNRTQENAPITEHNSMPSSPEDGPALQTTDAYVSQDSTPSPVVDSINEGNLTSLPSNISTEISSEI